MTDVTRVEPTPEVVTCHLCDRPASVLLRRVPACSSHAVRHLAACSPAGTGDPATETAATAGPDSWIAANLAFPPAAGVTATLEATPTAI